MAQFHGGQLQPHVAAKPCGRDRLVLYSVHLHSAFIVKVNPTASFNHTHTHR